MFYEKNNAPIFTICLCIIVAGVGFLGGYFVSGYHANHTYQEKQAVYQKQINTLKSESKSAQASLEKAQEELKASQTELARQKSSSNESTNENDTADASAPLNDNSITEAPSSDTSTSSDNQSSEPKYLLKIYHNKPTVFDYSDGKEGEIKTIINTDINSLGKNDRAMLEKGIVIDGDEQLAQVLEDYSS